MNFDEVYQTVQSQGSTSSGRGPSYWNEANRCGRLVNLKAANPMPELQVGEEINPLRVGIFYHALHQFRLKPNDINNIWDMTDSAIEDIDWMEALRLFRAYNQHWVRPELKWRARVESVEVKFPRSEAMQNLIFKMFGDHVTLRADWTGYISDIDWVYTNTGLMLPEPGVYIFDHKTTGARKEIHQWEFGFGNQSAIYLYLYNLEHPDAPAKGMIFDQIIRHKDISKEALLNKNGTLKRESSFTHTLALPNDDAEKLIQNMVRRGKRSIEENEANPEHCFSDYNPCHFYKTGQCRRF